MGEPVAALVLIVEDNAETRDVLERVLLISGFDVRRATDGLDALAYFRSGGRASAIVLDIAMPRMDGIQLRRALSADPRWADIPVIVYTANTHLRVPDVIGVFRKGTDDPNRLLEMLAVACTGGSEPSRSH
jgi:CheY-like chemotaxis protein